MKRSLLPLLIVACCVWPARGYIESPHSVGRLCKESTHILVVVVERVDTQKNLIIYRKLKDLKGKHPDELIRHNIAQKGSHPREWQTVMKWAKPGRRAVFFHNGQASITGIDDYWYQCFVEGQWWGMTHAEPFLLRTYWGSADRLAVAVMEILGGKEVVVPAMVDGPPEQFHLRTGKAHRIRASLKLIDYDPKRDFVAAGRDTQAEPDAASRLALPTAPATPGPRLYRAINLNGPELEIDGHKWEASDAKDVVVRGQRFEDQKARLAPSTDERRARMIRSSIWGPGCAVELRNVPPGAYQVYAHVWEDNQAQVFDLRLNGRIVQQRYNSGSAGQWKRLGPWPVEVRSGRIVLENASPTHANLSGLEVWRVQPPVPAAVPLVTAGSAPGRKGAVAVDRDRRRVFVPCAIAPRKLAHLSDVYPIEVIATWPSPHGQKAHETIVTFEGIKPSEVHAALEQLGLKPGRPAREEGQTPTGPTLRLWLEVAGADGKTARLPIEQTLVAQGKPIAPVKWHFTGSAMRRPDPEKDEQVYGADVTGTLIAVFPVTDDVVIQSSLTLRDETNLKLETNKSILPKEGTSARLIIQAE